MTEGGLPAPGATAEEARLLTRWVGSASAPGSTGYTEIGIPLAVIEVCAGILKLRVRPRSDLLESLTGAGFRVSAEEQAVSYRSANRALLSAGGTK